jgi:hypothetical protein
VPGEVCDLRLFARMVSAGSHSETARRLNSSLPAVSRRLAAMELSAFARERSPAIDAAGMVKQEGSLGVPHQLRYFVRELAVGSTNSPHAGNHCTSPSHELGRPYAAGSYVINYTLDLTA